MKTLDEIKPGQSIGRYEFLVPIARGGMAAVWAARLKGTRGFSKIVAIKTMLPTLSDDPLFEQMFLDEAQLAAQIHHPNVVEIMDLGEQDDVLYQVMEYVDGESLATVLRTVAKRKEPIPLPIAVRIIMDACNGLHAAHELRNVEGNHLGLVHRDISPQNIMVSFDGVVKLVDFGVAKAAGRMSSETTAGQIKGKAPYMSPEQALGSKIDRRTDIFAMGIVLYQVTTGKHPFRGENDVATLHAILNRPAPSPRFIYPKYPRPLESALLKALQRDPEARFKTAAEMADAVSKVFPPTTRLPSVSEVGAYLQGLLGEGGAKRREALREAIRRVEVRATTIVNAESSGAVLLPLNELSSDVSSVEHHPQLLAPTERMDAQTLAANFTETDAETGPRIPANSVPSVQGYAASQPRPEAPDIDESDFKQPNKGKKIAMVVGGSMVGIGLIAGLALALSSSGPQPVASAEPAASTPPQADSVMPTASVTQAPEPDPLPSASVTASAEPADSAVPHEPPPAPEPSATAAPVATPTAIKPSTTGGKPPPPPATTEKPAATTAPTSTWKPPPVEDPGF